VKYLIAIILSIATCFATNDVFAQKEKKIVQFTGVVVDTETNQGIPGVHIFAPKGGRGTTSNPYGFFSMAVLEGDSMLISAVGSEKEVIKIPVLPEDKYNFTVVLSLKPDTTYLPELEVYPFPNEQIFKEAVLALQLPNQQDLNNMQRSMDQRMLNRMYRNLNMDGNNNYQYYMSQQANANNQKYQTSSLSLLDPFAWNRFIKSLKNK